MLRDRSSLSVVQRIGRAALGGAILGAAILAAVGCNDDTLTVPASTVNMPAEAPPNGPPVTTDDVAFTSEDNPVTTPDVLANDVDPEGRALAITGFSQPPNGQAVDNGNGTFTYTPDPDFNGTDSFTYTASDPEGYSTLGTVTVTVAPVNDAPVAGDDDAMTTVGKVVDIHVLANDADTDGDALTVSGFPATTLHGSSVADLGGGVLRYTAAAGFMGLDVFSYTVTDEGGDGASAQVRVLVGPVKLVGEADSDMAGYCVACAGDVNGDGFADLLVAAYGSDAGGTDRGATYLFYGSRAALSGVINVAAADATFVGEADSDAAGLSVACAGDVDGDGFDDIIIGAYGRNATGLDHGAAYLVYGSDPGPSGTIDLSTGADAVFVGEESNDFAGWSVAGAGDVDGDGYDDLIIGARFHDAGGALGDNLGAAYLIYGSDPGPIGPIDLSTAGAKFVGEELLDDASFAVSGAGDVNGDGYDDLLVGARYQDAGGTDRGAAYLVYGSDPGPGGTIDLSAAGAKFVGEADSDQAGFSVSGAGDVNGDGFDDLIVGALLHDDGGGAADNPGAAYLIYGSSGGPIGTIALAAADAKLVGEALDNEAGYSVSGAGDVNGDGFDDLVVGAPKFDGSGVFVGAAYVLYGPVYGPVDLSAASAKFVGEATSDLAGLSVAGLGDVNGDGRPDLLVGAPYHNAGGSMRGAAYVIYGPVSGTITP